MRIAVDALGTDQHPAPDVSGALLAAEEYSNDHIILVGPEKQIKDEISKRGRQPSNVDIVDATQRITMDDRPSAVGREKPNSSMHVGMQLVRDNQADAFVTAGNTGAAHAIAMLFTLKRIRGVKRPALSLIFPIYDRPVIFLDVGANADSKAEWMAQYAIMGNIYAQNALGLDKPRVGLISNGEEEGKGTQVIRDAATLIEELSLNFIGNIEPRDMHNSVADVVITDGFTGNIMLKTFESSTRYITNMIRSELRNGILSTLGAMLSINAFNRVRKRVDPGEIGGAPLLGIQGVVIIAHGSSDARAIKNAINQARQAVNGRIVEAITHQIAAMSQS